MPLVGTGRNVIANSVPVHHSIASLVAGGHTGLGDKEAQGHFTNLVNSLGVRDAQSIAASILHNNRINGDTEGDVIASRTMPRARTDADNTADVRDSISALVGGGYKNIADKDSSGHFARLVSILGKDKAIKIMNNILIHNQRPEVGRLSPQGRLDNFFNTIKGDDEAAKEIAKVKTFGYGIGEGFRNSVNATNQKLNGTFADGADNKNSNLSLRGNAILKKL